MERSARVELSFEAAREPGRGQTSRVRVRRPARGASAPGPWEYDWLDLSLPEENAKRVERTLTLPLGKTVVVEATSSGPTARVLALQVTRVE